MLWNQDDMSSRSPRSALRNLLAVNSLAAACLIGSPAHAQIVPFAEIAGYTVARVQSQGICFAAVELNSIGGHPMVYTYYQTAAGQRWNVAGYKSGDILPDERAEIEVSVDDEVTLARDTEVRNGDFMLPFEALEEIQAHEAKIRSGQTMNISINEGSDQLVIGLADHRAALGAIQTCLSAL